MGTYINCGVTVDGARIKSKKTLKELMYSTPEVIVFDPTSMLEDQTPIAGNHLPQGRILSVCGPDPYNDRRWYASVKVVKGEIIVS